MQRWEEVEYARDEGRIEGLNKKLIQLTCKKISKGKTPEEIADDLEENLEQIERICDAAKEYAPDYDCDKIYEKMYE